MTDLTKEEIEHIKKLLSMDIKICELVKVKNYVPEHYQNLININYSILKKLTNKNQLPQ